MIYYLNMGLVLEQALVDIVKTYIDRQQFDDVYGNYHIHVVNQHPFTHMILDKNARTSDHFPSICISSNSDSKPSEMNGMPPQITGVGYTSDELDEIVNAGFRFKKKILENGEEVAVVKNGIVQRERIPGYVLVYDENSINNLKQIADSRTSGETKGMVYGIKACTRRRDRVSVEIWAENNQLKNEIYEHLRILFSSTLEMLMQEKFKMFDPSIFDSSVHGERSSNYNFDFDCILSGSNITMEIDYNVAQIILDTQINNVNADLIIEVMNHVKD